MRLRRSACGACPAIGPPCTAILHVEQSCTLGQEQCTPQGAADAHDQRGTPRRCNAQGRTAQVAVSVALPLATCCARAIQVAAQLTLKVSLQGQARQGREQVGQGAQLHAEQHAHTKPCPGPAPTHPSSPGCSSRSGASYRMSAAHIAHSRLCCPAASACCMAMATRGGRRACSPRPPCMWVPNRGASNLCASRYMWGRRGKTGLRCGPSHGHSTCSRWPLAALEW